MNRENIEIIQINISGEDKPGLTSSLTGILARHDAFILDIGQSNIHQSLTLGILFMTTPERSGQIMKELLFKASEMNITIRFEPISAEQYSHWVTGQGKNLYLHTSRLSFLDPQPNSHRNRRSQRRKPYDRNNRFKRYSRGRRPLRP